VNSIKNNRVVWILPVNFVLVPALALGVVRVFKIPTDIAVGMMLLEAAPFAPVVPIFAKMARGDLALAGALTALFPFFSAFLTPVICEVTLKPLLGGGWYAFNFFVILLALVSTITMPLLAGIACNHFLPVFGSRLLRPLEIVTEIIGGFSLAYVTVVEFPTILGIGWKPLLTMVLLSEVTLLLGYATGGPSIGARRVVALGTSNRNIALALLIAIQGFGDTPVVGAVVGNGLLLIFLGLMHVGFWRLRTWARHHG
jgi:BASS family bile acid:Na+ symporter